MKSREYFTLACNDRSVILSAALRRGFSEMLAFTCASPPPSNDYAPRSFQAVMGYTNALRAAYLEHLPRKLRQRLQERAEHVSLLSLRADIAGLLQSDVDQVTSARLGISLSAILIVNQFGDICDEHVDLGDLTYGDDFESGGIAVAEAIAALAEHQFAANGIVTESARAYLATLRPELESAHIEVISHDLSAPLIIVAPSSFVPLVSAEDLSEQIPSVGTHLINNRLGDIMFEVAERMLDQQDDRT